MSETVQTTNEPAAILPGAVTDPPPLNPTNSIAEYEAKKESLIAKIEAKLAAIQHEAVAEVKALVAELKAHL